MITAGGKPQRNILVDTQTPANLVTKLKLTLPDEAIGKEGIIEFIENVLKYSVNTWDQGFMDKLYASNTPVRFMMFGLFGNHPQPANLSRSA